MQRYVHAYSSYWKTFLVISDERHRHSGWIPPTNSTIKNKKQGHFGYRASAEMIFVAALIL